MGVKTGLHALSGRIRRMDGRQRLHAAGEQAGRRMLDIVRPLTPAEGGNLRESWRLAGIVQEGQLLRVEIENSAEYASFVEEGHRQTPERFVPTIGKTLVEDFVPGRFFLRAAEDIYRNERDAALEEMVRKYLGQVFGDDEE